MSFSVSFDFALLRQCQRVSEIRKEDAKLRLKRSETVSAAFFGAQIAAPNPRGLRRENAFDSEEQRNYSPLPSFYVAMRL